MFRPLAGDELHNVQSAVSVETWIPIAPVPADTPQLTDGILAEWVKPGYSVTKSWRYLDAKSNLLGYIVRCDGNGDKDIAPITFCAGPDGAREWRKKSWSTPRPLYGLDRLAARPYAPVIVTEGEKAADAAEKLFPDHVAVTSPGGSNAAEKADWSVLKGRDVIVWPDHDDAGEKYAADVVRLVSQAGATSVTIVSMPASFPYKWDLADQIPEGVIVDNLTDMLEQAEPSVEGPIPLYPALPPAEPFPIQALGPLLSRTAAAISSKVQVPAAIAAQSVLAAAALAAQAHADVMLPYGQKRPLSLFFVTVAASGDRKSTADNEALWPVRKREKTLKEEFEAEHKEWTISTSAYNAEKKKIENDRKMDFDARRHALTNLGPEPQRPLHPFLTAPEPTIEGLTKAWATAPAALGIFSAEGGQFIGGHGMSPDNRLKTAAAYSEIWDGHVIKRIRSSDGVSLLLGRRLSMHLMVQYEAASQFLADPLLRDQGLLSRVLVAAPQSVAGTRLYRETPPEDEAAIRAYGARILSILEARWPLANGSQNELQPRVLTMRADAKAIWSTFYDHIELQCGPDNDLHPIQDFAAKAAEHAARIAGVLTIVENHEASEISLPAMESAIVLADWYVNETLRLQRVARTDSKLQVAQQLLEWLRERQQIIGFREIVQFGPATTRTKRAADEALAILSAHGWVVEVSARPRKFKVVKEA